MSNQTCIKYIKYVVFFLSNQLNIFKLISIIIWLHVQKNIFCEILNQNGQQYS